MDTETRAFLEAMEERIVGALRVEMREGFDTVDRRFGEADKRLVGIEGQVESLARSTATEFERAHTSLAEITENTARSFNRVESRMQEIKA